MLSNKPSTNQEDIAHFAEQIGSLPAHNYTSHEVIKFITLIFQMPNILILNTS